MTKSFISLFLVMTLLLTNATGSHCHELKCSADSSLAALLDIDTEVHHGHDHDDPLQDNSDDSSAGKLAQSNTHEAHSHAFDHATYHAVSLLLIGITRSSEVVQQSFFISASIKPPLEPPSHS